ncbi:MAG: rubrerythrin family protein [Promethearchaeota archaeon]
MSGLIQNLKEAIIGESNAKRKYEMYSERAQEEQLPEISHLFKAISSAEAIHIKNHIKALSILTKIEVKIEEIVNINEELLRKTVKDTRTNLKDAINGETYETKQMYKGFVKNAKNEDNEVVELAFTLARKAEKVHANLFTKYLKKLEKNQSIDNMKIYVCQICGNVEIGDIPLVCPVCDHNQRFFKEI